MACELTEREYDEEFAPILLKLCEMAKERGAGFVALVSFDRRDGEGIAHGRTAGFGDNATPDIMVAYYGAACQGNADRLIRQLLKDVSKNPGHDSIYLRALEKAGWKGKS